MLLTINEEQLRKALSDIDKAKKNGFNFCLATFELIQFDGDIYKRNAEYKDMCERAHPTDGRFDWGRGQNVTGRNKFKAGKLVPIKTKR